MRLTRSRRTSAMVLLFTVVVLAAGAVAVLSNREGSAETPGAGPTAAPTVTIAQAALPATSGIEASRRVNGVDVSLGVSPPDLGATELEVTVRVGGIALAGDMVWVRLAMPAFPSLGSSTYTLKAFSASYRASASFAALGRWQAVVRVTGPGLSAPIQARFDLLVGPEAGFVALPPLHARYGPATISYTAAADGSADVRIHLRAGLRVRFAFAMPSMPEMGRPAFPMHAQTGGWYDGQIVFGMSGVTAISIQVLDHGAWQLARELLFDAGSTNRGVLFASSPIVH